MLRPAGPRIESAPIDRLWRIRLTAKLLVGFWGCILGILIAVKRSQDQSSPVKTDAAAP